MTRARRCLIFSRLVKRSYHKSELDLVLERSKLLTLFRETASEISETDLSHIGEESMISGLGLDSLSTLELVGEFERELSIRIEIETLSDVVSVGEFLALVEGHLSGPVRAATAA